MGNEEVLEKMIKLYSKDWDRFYSESELIKKLNINKDELEEALTIFTNSENWGSVWIDYSSGTINYQIQPKSYVHESQERYNKLEDRLKEKYGKIGIKFAYLRLHLRIEIAGSKCLKQLLGKNNIDRLKKILV